MDLDAEFQEFLAAVKAATADGKLTLDELPEIVLQFIDVLAPIIAAMTGDDAAIEALKESATDAAKKAVNMLPDGRFLSRQAVLMGVSMGVPWLVGAIAKVGKPATIWVEDHLRPYLVFGEQFCHRLNVALGA